MPGDGQLQFPIPYGKYELLERIGDGGMAEVFRARHPGVAGFEKTVVIKRMLPHLSRKPTFVEMFVGEAKLAAQVQHRNVVQVYELSQHDNGEFFIVMEYVEGTDLRRVLKFAARRQLRLPPWFSLHVVSETLDALAYAHNIRNDAGELRNIVHRDVTPSNLFISKLGETKLGDFGVAHDAARPAQTRAGQLKGKVAYMAPEQLYSRAVDARTDVFAAGVVLWECLTQRRLFGGGPDIEVMNKIVNGARRPATRYAHDIPKELNDLIEKAISVDPAQRFQSARDMQNALLDVAPALGPSARPEMVRAVVEVMMGRTSPEGAAIATLENSRRPSPSESSPSHLHSRAGSHSGLRSFGSTATSSPAVGDPLDDPFYHKQRGDSSPRATSSKQAIGGGSFEIVDDLLPPPTPIPVVQKTTTGDIQAALAQSVTAQAKTPTPPIGHAMPRHGAPQSSSTKQNAMLDHFRRVPAQLPAQLPPSLPPLPPPKPRARFNSETERATTGPGGAPLNSSDLESNVPRFETITGPLPMAGSVGSVGGTPRPSAWAATPAPTIVPSRPVEPPRSPNLADSSPHRPVDQNFDPNHALAELRAITGDLPPLPRMPSRLPPTPLRNEAPVELSPDVVAPIPPPTAPPRPGQTPPAEIDAIDAIVAQAVEEVRDMPESRLEVVRSDSMIAGLDRRRHGARVSDHATKKWAAFGLDDAIFEGPNPFWLCANNGDRIGPCRYEQAIAIVRAELKDRLSESSKISPNGVDWMSLREFAQLVGMESMLRHDDEIVPGTGLLVGSLEKRSLAAVFGVLSRNEATGRLFVVDRGHHRTDFREIEVVKGQPTYVYANEDKLQLPDLLVSRNLVPKMLIGKLVHDALTQKTTLTSQASIYLASDVGRYRTLFMKERLVDLFSRGQGRFTFERLDEPKHSRPFAKSLIGLLPELVHRAMGNDVLERKLAPHYNAELKTCESFAQKLDDMNLTRAQLGAAWMLGQGRRIEALVRQWPEDKRLHLTMAYVLIETELLRPV